MAVDEIGHCAHLMNRFLGSLTQKKEEVARAITAEHGMMFIHASGVRRHTEQKSIMQTLAREYRSRVRVRHAGSPLRGMAGNAPRPL